MGDDGIGAALAQVRSFLDALPRATAVVGPDGRVVAWNLAAEHCYGWRRADALDRDLGEVLVPVAGDDPAAALATSLAQGEAWTGEFSVLGADGRVVRLQAHAAAVVDPQGRVTAAALVADDVTEARLLERRTEDLAAHLGLALAAGELGTWRWDRASGVTVWDEAMERLFGLAPGTFDGTFDSWVSMLHPEDRRGVLASVEEAVAGRSAYRIDHRVVHPDGTVRWIHGRGRVTLDEDGRVTGTVGCSTDITERKVAELRAGELAQAAHERAERDRRERERLEFLAGLTQSALTAGDHLRFMEEVTRAAVPKLGDWCSLHFAPPGTEEPETSVAHHDPAKVAWARELAERYPYDPDAPTGVPAVIRTGEPEIHLDVDQALIDDALEQSSLEAHEVPEVRAVLDALQLTSVITVPLRTTSGVIGAMQFVSAESGRRYDERDVALAEAAAGRIAEALDALWSSDRHRHIAATLQRALLPSTLPDIDGVDVAVRYWPAGAGDVGGDFYDLFQVAPDRWAVVIGDVCGKGAEAAGLTGVARHTVRAAATHGRSATEVLEWLNDAVRHADPDRFLTACYAVLSREAGGWSLESTAGGHPLPVVVRADGGVATVGGHGTLLGAFDAIVAHPGAVPLDPGDTVVFFTDGISDVRPPYDLSDEEVHALVGSSAAAAATADGVADDLDRRLAGHLPMAHRQDDIALVVLRVTAAGPPPAAPPG